MRLSKRKKTFVLTGVSCIFFLIFAFFCCIYFIPSRVSILGERITTAYRKGDFDMMYKYVRQYDACVQKLNNQYYSTNLKYWQEIVYEMRGECQKLPMFNSLDELTNAEKDFIFDRVDFRPSKSSYAFRDARICYKRGDREEAFQRYCLTAQAILTGKYGVKDNVAFQDCTVENQDNLLYEERFAILMITDDPLERRFAPFTEYSDFLRFMETEFEKLDKPEEYADAMELFRRIASYNDKDEFKIEQAKKFQQETEEQVENLRSHGLVATLLLAIRRFAMKAY